MRDLSAARRTVGHMLLRAIFFHVPAAIVGALVLATVAITGANVVARYVFLKPFFWAEEALTYTMIVFVFLGAVLVTWDDRHLKMDILSQMLRGAWRTAVNFVSTVLFVVVCGFMVTQSFEVASMLGAFGKRSVAAEIPMVIPHSVLGVCFAMMAIVVVYRFRAYVRGEPPTGSLGDAGLEGAAGAASARPGVDDGM